MVPSDIVKAGHISFWNLIIPENVFDNRIKGCKTKALDWLEVHKCQPADSSFCLGIPSTGFPHTTCAL